jgi:hypothetical protein
VHGMSVKLAQMGEARHDSGLVPGCDQCPLTLVLHLSMEEACKPSIYPLRVCNHGSAWSLAQGGTMFTHFETRWLQMVHHLLRIPSPGAEVRSPSAFDRC